MKILSFPSATIVLCHLLSSASLLTTTGAVNHEKNEMVTDQDMTTPSSTLKLLRNGNNKNTKKKKMMKTWETQNQRRDLLLEEEEEDDSLMAQCLTTTTSSYNPFIIPPTTTNNTTTWKPFGQSFTGAIDSVINGPGLSLSKNGRIMAVYSFFADLPDDDGHQRFLEEEDEDEEAAMLSPFQDEWIEVYQMSDDDDTKWIRMGQVITEVGDTGRFNEGGADMMRLSGDGMTVGLRFDYALRLLSYNETRDKWMNLAEVDFRDYDDDDNVNNGRGSRAWVYDFAMSSDGRTVALARVSRFVSWIRVLRYDDDEGSWVELGEKITQPMVLPMVMSFSEDGRILATAGRRTNVTVFALSEDEAGKEVWGQVGDSIGVGRNTIDMSLSSDGKFVAVGEADENWGRIVGFVKVYTLSGEGWIPVGQPVMGKSKFDGFGMKVHLSDDACSLTVAATGGYKTGKIRMYSFNGTDWAERGDAIDAYGERSEDIVAFSGDGSVVVTTRVGPNTIPYGLDYEYINGYVSAYRASTFAGSSTRL